MAPKGRIELQCPQCGNIQSEPEFAKSTYCRKCNTYIPLEKGKRKVDLPAEGGGGSPSVLHRLEGMLGVVQRPTIAHCFECPGKREVPKSASSTICPQCGAYIDLQDYKITGNFSRSIRTRGSLTITSRGDLNSNRVICASAEIQGPLRGSLTCTGEVHIRFKGKFSGSIQAKKVLVDRRSEIEFVRPIKSDQIDIEGLISARIISSGTVTVRKAARLTGAVFAKGFLVEKGGEFFGDLSIGKAELTQSELSMPAGDPKDQSTRSDPGTGFSLAPA